MIITYIPSLPDWRIRNGAAIENFSYLCVTVHSILCITLQQTSPCNCYITIGYCKMVLDYVFSNIFTPLTFNIMSLSIQTEQSFQTEICQLEKSNPALCVTLHFQWNFVNHEMDICWNTCYLFSKKRLKIVLHAMKLENNI